MERFIRTSPIGFRARPKLDLQYTRYRAQVAKSSGELSTVDFVVGLLKPKEDDMLDSSCQVILVSELFLVTARNGKTISATARISRRRLLPSKTQNKSLHLPGSGSRQTFYEVESPRSLVPRKFAGNPVFQGHTYFR
jgi:hypothetical protein